MRKFMLNAATCLHAICNHLALLGLAGGFSIKILYSCNTKSCEGKNGRSQHYIPPKLCMKRRTKCARLIVWINTV